MEATEDPGMVSSHLLLSGLDAAHGRRGNDLAFRTQVMLTHWTREAITGFNKWESVSAMLQYKPSDYVTYSEVL